MRAVSTTAHVTPPPPFTIPYDKALGLLSKRPVYAIAIFDHLGTLSVDVLYLRTYWKLRSACRCCSWGHAKCAEKDSQGKNVLFMRLQFSRQSGE